jgi:hypothetical protein
LYADVVFVTYSRSRIYDKREFHVCLKRTLSSVLFRSKATRGVCVRVFGSKELHEDGVPHYHVLLRFSKKVYWEGAREKLLVMVKRDGEYVPDTGSVYIRKKPQAETLEQFLYSVQTYIAKGGNVFGKWVYD